MDTLARKMFLKIVLMMIFATIFTTSVRAKESPALSVSNTILQIEMLKASIAEIKENQKLGAAKQDAQDAKIRESDKNAIDANANAKNTSETLNAVWMPAFGGLVLFLLAQGGVIYIGITILAKSAAKTEFAKLMPQMLENYLNTEPGKNYLTQVMTPIAKATSLEQAQISVQQLSGAMLAATFHNSGRQDLLETMLSKLKREMPAINADLCKHELQLLMHSYAKIQSKYHCVYELAKQALTLNPNDSEVLAANGLICTRMGKYDEALPHLRKAIQLAPNDRSRCVHQWTFAYCILKKADQKLIDEGINAAREALVQLSHNKKLKMTFINCQALSSKADVFNDGLTSAIGLLNKCNNDKDPLEALSIWRGLQPILQRQLDPARFGFAQLMA